MIDRLKRDRWLTSFSTRVQDKGHPSEGHRQAGDGRSCSTWRHGDPSTAGPPARSGERRSHGRAASQEQHPAEPAQEGSGRVQRCEASGQGGRRFKHGRSDEGIVRDGCSCGEINNPARFVDVQLKTAVCLLAFRDPNPPHSPPAAYFTPRLSPLSAM